MADDDIYSVLSPNDILSFNQNALSRNPFGIAGGALGNTQLDMRTWDAPTVGVASFGKAFLQGLLTNYAQQDAARQTQAVINSFPQLSQNPGGMATPEGVDESAFGLLRGTVAANNAKARAADARASKANVSDLLKSVLPDLVKTRQISMSDAIGLAGSDSPSEMLLQPQGQTPSPVVDAAVPDSPLASGKDSSMVKYKRYFQDLVASGQPPVQAAAAARAQVEGEVKANSKSFDDAKAAREYGENLLQLSNTARAGLSSAGQTGSGLASGYEKLVATLAPILPGSQSEAIQQSAGDTLLDSIAPDVIKMARPTGGGATSDFEARAYLGSGPGTNNTPEANAMLISKMEKLGKLNLDYADFLEAYREANAGSVAGAGKKWSEYKQAFPIFDGGEINEARPSWQEYFEAVGSGEMPSGSVEPQAAGNKYTIDALRSAGYTESDIKDLSAKGFVK